MVLAVVTCSDYPNLTGDDTPLVVSELRSQGVNTEVVVWDSQEVRWDRFSAAIVRSTWDYSQRRDEYLTWIDRISRQTQLWNPAQVLTWNTHKHYLRDLKAQGIPVLPTEWLLAGDCANLADIMERWQWQKVVIKPAVSANSRRTIVVTHDRLAEGQVHLERYLPERDMMVQKYEPSIVDLGERSLIFIAGEFSHSVVKTPAAGDYRIQSSFGGQARPIVPTPEDLALAQAVLATVSQPLLYARVDVVGEGETLAAIEVELAEPSLYLEYVPELIPKAIARMVTFLESEGVVLS